MLKHNLTWLAVFGVVALMFLWLPYMVAKQDAVLQTYSALVEVDALVRQKFAEPIHPQADRLADGAIRGLLLTLDPYSGYIAPDELPAFERRMRGDYIGVGVEVGMRNGMVTVIAPFEGSPAAKAGVLAGDVILAVDGQEIEGLSVFDVIGLLAGAPGTTVRLRVQHQSEPESEALTIVRGPVSINTVRGFRRPPKADSGQWEYMIDPDERIGYIRVSSFRDNTMRDFDAALRRLLGQGGRGLIIDLRFNPGGVMHQGIAMVDRFVENGVILSTVTRHKAVQEYLATKRDTITDVEAVVLINHGSASASEIVAGGLQAHDRAMVVGERSFGKGSVQHLIHLTEHEAAIKLTVAYYRLPDGRIIHRTTKNANSDSWGVAPDVEITLSDDEVRAIQASRRALDLVGHPNHTRSLPYRDRKGAVVSKRDRRDPYRDRKGAATGTLRPPDQTAALEIIHDRQLLEALRLLQERIRGSGP